MAYKNGTCYICEDEKPVQDHHLIPLEYGGPKKGPTIKVCPTCHLTCHYEAEFYAANGEFLQLDVTFTNGEINRRARKVIDYIVQAKLTHEASGEHAKEARRRVAIALSHEELQMVHALKSVLGFRSLERMIKSFIASAIQENRSKGKI